LKYVRVRLAVLALRRENDSHLCIESRDERGVTGVSRSVMIDLGDLHIANLGRDLGFNVAMSPIVETGDR
jgi:hypothetical protein